MGKSKNIPSIDDISKEIKSRKERCRSFYNAEISEKVVDGADIWRLI